MVAQAREILGHQSFVKKRQVHAERATDKEMSKFISETTLKFTAKKDKKLAKKISRALIASAKKYDLDPLFLMAVVQNESSFRTRQLGAAGEIGLMQILPNTAEWISKIYHLPYQGEQDLFDPAKNIEIGAALFDKLRKQFDGVGQMYLSAYNVGATKVRRMVEDNNPPKIYVLSVMKRYFAILEGFKARGNVSDRSKIALQKTQALTALRVRL